LIGIGARRIRNAVDISNFCGHAVPCDHWEIASMKQLLAIVISGGLLVSAATAGPLVLAPVQLDSITAGGCAAAATTDGQTVASCVGPVIHTGAFDFLGRKFPERVFREWPMPLPGSEPDPFGPIPTEPPGCETGACNSTPILP
jgi:hypothetical protein